MPGIYTLVYVQFIVNLTIVYHAGSARAGGKYLTYTHVLEAHILLMRIDANHPRSTREALAKILCRHALKSGPLSHDPEWFNSDENFALAVQQALFLQVGAPY